MLTRPDRPAPYTLMFNGRPIAAHPGDSAAAALVAAGIVATRETATGAPRGAFCMMGACFDCIATIDGQSGVQLCLTPARDGMRIETQHGPRRLADEA